MIVLSYWTVIIVIVQNRHREKNNVQEDFIMRNSLRKSIPLFVMCFTALLPGSRQTEAAFQKEVTMDLTRMQWTNFGICLPAEDARDYGATSYSPRWYITEEECKGKDEVFVRMDVPSTSELWLETDERGWIEYDLLDSNRNVLQEGFARTGPDFQDTLAILAREVFPAGTYYWRFHNYYDSDCKGSFNVGVRAVEIIAATDDDAAGNNNSMKTATPLKENTPAKGMLSPIGNDPEDWYRFHVEDASSETLSIKSSIGYIYLSIYDAAGKVIKDKVFTSCDGTSVSLNLPDGDYYVQLVPDKGGQAKQDYAGGRYTMGLQYGGSYTLTYSQTKNFHPVPATSVKLNKTSVTLDPSPLAFYGPFTEITATLVPANSTDTITWEISNTNMVAFSTRSGNSCSIYSTNLEGGTATVTARIDGKPSVSASCTVKVNQYKTPSGTLPEEATKNWYIHLSKDKITLNPGDSFSIGYQAYGDGNNITWTSSNNKVATAEGAHITAKGPGTAVITASYNRASNVKATCKVTVNATSGSVLKNGSASYKVQPNLKTVAYLAPLKKSVKTVEIPAKVKLNGKTYKVTAVANNAFRKCKKLTKVTIGQNVTSIGSSAFEQCTALKTVTMENKVTSIGRKAFYGDKKLNKVTIKSSKLKTVGSNVFKGINAKAKIYVPKKKVKNYKKLLTGVGKKMKILSL